MSVSMPVHMTMTVPAAAVSFAMVMMAAMYRRVVSKFSGDKVIHRRIRFSLHAAVYGDSSLRQCVLRSRSDAAADQSIHMFFLEQRG